MQLLQILLPCEKCLEQICWPHSVHLSKHFLQDSCPHWVQSLTEHALHLGLLQAGQEEIQEEHAAWPEVHKIVDFNGREQTSQGTGVISPVTAL